MVITEPRAGRLLSVNVGLPQDVAWHGRTVHTAVWKQPVEGPRMVRRLNIDGDGQGDLAGHGGEHRAVFVYQIESYRYWQRQLGRDDFVHGQFGENFTVDGLADDQVRIGDRYQIGGALFEVTQPRVTCYRVGIRMGNPQIPALLVSHHRPGFYLRVLREGPVQAGDDIVQVASGPEGMTVAEVDALLYLPGHSRQRVAEALRIPALPDGWKASFRALLDQPGSPGGPGGNAGLAPASPPPAWPGFRPLAVTAVERETGSVISVYLADPGGAAVPPAQPGQFLTLRLPAGPGAQPLVRSYSLSGPPGASTYRISVKREPHGAGSQFMHTRVREGDLLDVAAPRGTFILQPGRDTGPADQRRGGGDPGPGHAARPGRRRVPPRYLVAARGPEPGGRAVCGGIAVAARGTAQRAPPHQLQPPGPGRRPGARLPDAWTADRGRAGRPRPATRRGCLPLRSGRVHGPDVRGAGGPGYRRAGCTPRSSAAWARPRRASRPPRPGRRTSRRARPAPARASCSRAAA